MRRGSRGSAGFTLIELMLVMAIIALIATSVMFTMPSTSGSDRSPQDIAVTLQQQLQYAREHAMLKQQPVGVRFDDQGYQFMQWREQQWRPLELRGLRSVQVTDPIGWQLQPVSDGIRANLVQQQEEDAASLFQPDNEQQEGEQKLPQVMILPSGEMTAFQLQISDYQQPDRNRWLVTNGAWQVAIQEQADASR